MYRELPMPDEFGNYWLSIHARDPAILKGGKGDGGVAENGGRTMRNDRDRWFVSVGDGELLFSGTSLAYFASPKLALDEAL